MARTKQTARKQTVTPAVRAMVARRRERLHAKVPADMRAVLDKAHDIQFFLADAMDSMQRAMDEAREGLEAIHASVGKMKTKIMSHFDAQDSDADDDSDSSDSSDDEDSPDPATAADTNGDDVAAGSGKEDEIVCID